jgi:RND family efflux transporter MFP subunit
MTMSQKLWVPLLIAVVSSLGAFVVVATAPSVEYVEPERAIPTVRTIPAQTETLRYRVRSQGTVSPRTEADLVSEISGRVVWVAPSLVPGGYFKAGDPLLRLERRDFELTVSRQRASLKRATSELEFAASQLARRQNLSDAGVASSSHLSEARRAAGVAEANVSDARAALEQANRDLDRTELRAPFDGRVRDKQVDTGQFVTRGNAIAKVYATDYVEIRLPIPDDQLAFLNLPDPRRTGADTKIEGPVVQLSSVFAGSRHEWTGRIVRTEGEIDSRSRMINVVARVEKPYAESDVESRPPLAVGLFVEAEIIGPEAKDVIVIPRYAMRDNSSILVVDAENRIRTRQLSVLRIERDSVLVKGPLAPGEKICVSPLQVVVEGMVVRTVEEVARVPGRASDS